MMENLKRITGKTAYIISFLIFASVAVFGMIFEADYSFLDYPYFRINDPSKILYILISLCMVIAHMYIGSRISWNVKAVIFIYIAASLVYIFLIPLEPYSDMKYIYDIAVNGLRDETGYLSVYNNQIPVTLYLWIVMGIFGKSIIVPKILNVVFNIIILIFMRRIYMLFGKSENDAKGIIWFSSTFMAVFLYVNHIYNDILFTMLTVILIYMILKREYTAVRSGIICLLSVVQYLIRPSGIIYIIAIVLFMVFYQKEWKKCIVYICAVTIMITGIVKINKAFFCVDEDKTYPVWSFIQMGVNEEEFGFQDGTHSPDWTFEDCVDKYKELGAAKVLKIFAKKEIWMWSEGTYQAQRYAFGDENAAYERENIITDNIRDIDESPIRNIVENFMKAQYYIYILFALSGIAAVRNEKKCVLLFYLICGFFFFYMFWEIKSRYIYSLYPILMILSYTGWNNFVCKIKSCNKLTSCGQ